MRKLNANRFQSHTTNFGTMSGSSPVPLPNPAGPATSPPGRAIQPLIRLARPQDLKYLSSLQKRFSNELGFLPTQALQWYVEHQRVGVVTENGDPAGYVLGRTHFKYQPLLRPITQTAIQMDAQRRHLGLALVNRICKQAIDARQLAVQAICAEDLDANDFWAVAGFVPIGEQTHHNARGRNLIVWRKQLTSTLPAWFNLLPTAPGERARRK